MGPLKRKTRATVGVGRYKEPSISQDTLLVKILLNNIEQSLFNFLSFLYI